MLKSYLKIAFRNIGRHKLFTGINLVGLAISMSLGLLILTVISDLLSYDNFHVNGRNIYRVISKVQNTSGNSDLKATCPFPVANELKTNYQGYKYITRIQRYFNAGANSNNKEIQLEGYYTDPSFLKMFSFPLLKGNINTALSEPNTVIITQKTATKFFGDTDPMGKLIAMGKLGDYVVAGIVSNPPENSHLKFDVLGSLSSLENLEKNNIVSATLDKWNGFLTNYVYIQKSEQTSIKQIKSDLNGVAQKSRSATDDLQLSFQLQPLNKIVPGPDLSSQIGPNMSYLPIFILSFITLLILLSACINYTNLSLARALRRAKEIGVRKAIGGSKKQLFAQFLTETMIISLLALIVAWLIFQFIKPEFLKVVPRASEMFTLNNSVLLVFAFFGFALLTGLLAGLLPATILSRLNVIRALKNDTSIKTLGRINLRKALIVFQFTLSLVFIVGIIVISRQSQFSKYYDHGFSVTNKMLIPLNGMNYEVFKNEFEKNPDVESVTGSSAMVGSFQTNSTWLKFPGKIDSLSADYLQTDDRFIENLGIGLLAGNSFATTDKSKEHAVIINEQLLLAIGAKQHKDAIGKLVTIDGEQIEVIGVVKDFNYAQLEEPIRNFMFIYKPQQVYYGYLNLSGTYNNNVKEGMEASWKKISGGSEFQGKTMAAFMEETYAFYANFIKIFGFIAFLAIAIGCLGLAGISLYAAQSRLKEVGIRKVMGASVGAILMLLLKGFLWLLLISSAIALPISYLLFNQILESGTYHIQIGFIELGSGLLILLLVGGLTVLAQTWKTAVSNPVKSLRTE